MANTRSQVPKGTTKPSPASEPVQKRRGQSKKNKDSEEEGPYQSPDQPPAPNKETKDKRRGSRKAAATTPGPAVTNEANPAVQTGPRKRGREPAADEADSAPPTKRGKEVQPRALLPDRQGRNVHPAGQPKKRRTPEEAAAEREAQRIAIETKIQEGEMAKRLLAEWNVAEDLDMSESRLQRLSAATRKRPRDEVEPSDEGEAFDFMEVDAMPDSESELGDKEPVLKNRAPKKRAKPAKGELRRDIQGMEDGIRGGSQKKSKTTTFDSNLPPLDTVPKQYQNAGLRKATRPKNSEPIDPFEHGGLNDEDIRSDRPPFNQSHTQAPVPPRYPENLQRNPSRKNELVQFVESSGQHAPTTKATNTKHTKPQAKPTLKALPAARAPPVPIANSVPGNTVNGSQFLHDARWKKVFNPTLTHALYISREPFLDFASESPQFLAIVQNAFNASFPDAYDRVKTRKSKLADAILKLVKAFFDKPEFHGKPDDIREYIRWALRDGPAYYGLPTPRDCKAKRGEPGYIAPDGFLESEFITPVAQKYLKYAANSAMHPPLNAKHPPKGLYAILLLCVERAFSAHISGQYTAPLKFTHENYWQPLKIFLGHVDSVSERRWGQILALGHADAEEVDEALQVNQSMISAFRAEIYIPASPVKA